MILLCIVTILFWGNFSLQPTNLLKLKPILIKENEVKPHTRLYDLTTGEFQGLQTELAFIMLRGDNNQAFFFFFRMFMTQIILLFYILRQNKKFQTPL